MAEPHATQSTVLQPFSQYSMAYSFGGSEQSHQIPLTFLHGMEGFSSPHFVLPSDTVNYKSVVGIKPGDSSVVIVYEAVGFTCTWLVEYFYWITHLPRVHEHSIITNQFPTLNRVL